MKTPNVDDTVSAIGLAEPHHDGSELYVDRLGDSAELRLRAPGGAAEAVFLRYLNDGEPRVVEAAPAAHDDGDVWWRAELPLRNPTVAYRWLLTGGDLGYRWVNGTGSYPYEVTPADDFVLSAEPAGADWHLASVGYEVFLDRFASSGTVRPLPDWAQPRDWHRLPDAHTRQGDVEYFGGDLAGVEQHLDHITSLGANVVWLSAFFPSESNHRYDATSFDRVDPLLGGDEALASLLRAGHARGLKFFGDFSVDHSGRGHEWFARARQDEASPERSFFLFDRSEAHGYGTWRGWNATPRFDWRSQELRARMSASVQRWLGLGLDGWRIGAADMAGRYRDVDLAADVARWFREQSGDAPLIAEYWDDFRPDIDGRGWNGVMNYAGFLRPVWWWLRDEEMGEMYDIFTRTTAPYYVGGELCTVMRATRAGAPWETTLHSWLMLDTHDTPRVRSVCGSRERQLVALGLQMTTPGVPMVYAGDELGLTGMSGRDSRQTMPWDRHERWDAHLLGEYRRLIELRRSSDALARGGIRYLHVTDDAVLYLRESRAERLLCLASRAQHEPITVPFRELETLYGDDAENGVLPAHGPAFHAWLV